MSEPLWATGPGEILRHALKLLEEDTDTNRRLAMIAIDNSVELILKTYISLPKRVTGLSISRKDRDEICSGFPQLLDGIEKHAASRLAGINLGEVEWFHRLRNELYHQGNGLTVERQKVEVYAELAKILFENLFETKIKLHESDSLRILGDFMSKWIEVEKNLSSVDESGRAVPSMRTIENLRQNGTISNAQAEEFRRLRLLRNELVHGKAQPEKKLNKQVINQLSSFSEIIARSLGL